MTTPASAHHRIRAVLLKEVIQMRRDRLTFAMIVGIPIIQLVLFGYAINSDPKQLPTGIVMADRGSGRARDRCRHAGRRSIFASTGDFSEARGAAKASPTARSPSSSPCRAISTPISRAAAMLRS